MAQVFCFGDSITYGSDDLTKTGWANQLRAFLDNKDNAYGLVYNLGISGEMTDGLVERFERETQSRLKVLKEIKRKNNTFIFAYGANDTIFFVSKNAFAIDSDKFKDNLVGVIRKAKELGDKVYIQTITPVVTDRIVNHPNKDKIRKNEYVDKYNCKILEIVEEEGINLIDINKAFVEQDYSGLF